MGGAKEEEGRSLEQYSAIFAKDWVEDFEVPTEAVVDEGRKTIDFLLKRYASLHCIGNIVYRISLVCSCSFMPFAS